jgi:hypothetical protein
VPATDRNGVEFSISKRRIFINDVDTPLVAADWGEWAEEGPGEDVCGPRSDGVQGKEAG